MDNERQMALLACFGLAFCLIFVMNGVEWERSLGVGGDNTQVYNFAKSSIDGFGFRYNPQLGYPGVQDNLIFPTFDFAYRSTLWLIGRFVNDATTSIKVFYVMGTSAMFIVAVSAFRSLQINAVLSIVGGLAFVATPYFGSRALTHDFLSLYVSAGSGAGLALMVGMMPVGQTWRDFTRQKAVLLAIVLAGTCGLYYGFFACLFTMFVGLISAIWQRRTDPLIAAVIVPAVVLPILVFTGYGFSILDVISGRIPQVTRAPMEQVIYGLNMAEAAAVYGNIPGLERILTDYRSAMPYVAGATGLFEWPGLVLTSVILTSPLLAAILVKAETHWTRLMLISSLCIVFGLLYAIKGGLAYYFNLFVAPNIRATDRIMPFLTFFAIVIALGFVEAGRQFLPRRTGYIVGAVIVAGLLLTVSENSGLLAAKQQAYAASFEERAQSTAAMLRAKNSAAVSAVLQLPYVAWPEQPPVRQFSVYAHQDAYILDPQSLTTKWSYGLAEIDPIFQSTKALLEDSTNLARDARSLGFDAILVEKAAYNHAELGRLADRIDGGCVIYDDSFRTLYLLGTQDDQSACIGG